MPRAVYPGAVMAVEPSPIYKPLPVERSEYPKRLSTGNELFITKHSLATRASTGVPQFPMYADRPDWEPLTSR